MFSKKNIFFTVFTFFLVWAADCEPRFSGIAGIKGDFFSDKTKEKFELNLEAGSFFAGQLDFGKNFFVRAEFSVQSENIIHEDIFNGSPSKFSLDELSATIHCAAGNIINYLSFFMGTFEPIGSDIFLQRQFSVSSVSSRLTDNWMGLNGSYVYPFYGFGGSYVLRFHPVPIATGLYVYTNKENPYEARQLAVDLRFATATRFFTLDLAGGVGIPLESEIKQEDTIFTIDTVYTHLGGSVLFGNNVSPVSLLAQGGFQTLPVKKSDKTKLRAEDVYLIFEPRIRSRGLCADLSFYSLPEEDIKKTLILEDTLGVDLDLFSDKILAGSNYIAIGLHSILSFPGLYVNALEDSENFKNAFKNDAYTVKIAPFTEIPAIGGTLSAMFQINITKIANNKDNKYKNHEWFEFNLGFKRKF